MQQASNETGLVRAFPLDQRLPLGFRFPTTCHALTLGEGELALVSPVPFSDATASALGGRVAYLMAPNLLHHLYLKAARASFPEAEVLAPRGLTKKVPNLKPDHELVTELPTELGRHISVYPIGGCPGLSECVIYHHASESLIVTDLFFHLLEPASAMAHLVLSAVGAHKKLAQSRAIYFLVKDRAAYFRSLHQVLELRPRAVYFAHGEPIFDSPAERLKEAARSSWLSAGKFTSHGS